MKSLMDFIAEDSSAPVNVTGDAVASRPTMMGAPVYQVPHDSYLKMMAGKQRGKKWCDILDDVDLTSELKKRLYSGKPTVLCNSTYPQQHIFLRMKD